MAGALAARQTDKEFEKGRVDATRVKRYWPGKAPDWVDNDAYEEAVPRVRTQIEPAVVVKKQDDPRLRRLAAVSREDRNDVVQRHREIRAAEIVKKRNEESEEPEDSDSEPLEGDVPDEVEEEQEQDLEEIERKRQAVRLRLLEQQRAREQQEAQAGADEEEEEEEEEEESSEYETDSDDDYYGSRRLLKPVFVKKEERETIAERERLEKEEELMFEKEKKRLEERKVETKQLVIERIVLEEAAAKNTGEVPRNLEDIDTDDEKDEEQEYESWKQRELNRIKRDRDERDALVKELEEKERLRSMTEEERREWDRLNPKVVAKAPKKKWKFLQKYWHRGAFFMEQPDDTRGTAGADPVFMRDYSAPTGEDVFDKTILPKVMQVKNFGRSGRTKWTHLVDQDTTAWDDAFTVNDALRTKYNKRLAGTELVFEKPKKLKT